MKTTRRGFFKWLGVGALSVAFPGSLGKAVKPKVSEVVPGQGFGLPSIKREGAAISYDSARYEHVRYGQSFFVEELLPEEEARANKARISALAQSMRQFHEDKCIEVFK